MYMTTLMHIQLPKNCQMIEKHIPKKVKSEDDPYLLKENGHSSIRIPSWMTYRVSYGWIHLVS